MCFIWMEFNMIIMYAFGPLGTAYKIINVLGYVNIIAQGVFIFLMIIKNKELFAPCILSLNNITEDSNEKQ